MQETLRQIRNNSTRIAFYSLTFPPCRYLCISPLLKEKKLLLSSP